MTTPYESDMWLSGFGDTSLDYRSEAVLMPDVVTDGLAYIAAHEINQRSDNNVVRVIELGAGCAPFLTLLSQRVSPARPLSLEAVDITDSTIPFAEYNVLQSLRARKNSEDTAQIRKANWDEVLSTDERFDCVYLNPPYLSSVEQVREEFRNAPNDSMYVAGSRDGLDHYRAVIPRLSNILHPNGLLIIRTPRNANKFEQVLKIVEESFDNATIHTAHVASELGEREGHGIVVDMSSKARRVYTVGFVRAVGLALKTLEQPQAC